MNRALIRRLAVAALCAAATALLHLPVWAQGYRYTRLDLPDGCVSASARAINETGTIVGTCLDTAGRQVAVYWDSTGVHRIFQGQDCQAVAIDDSGIIVGTQRATAIGTACFWDASGIHLLPKPYANYDSDAWGICNGVIVGGVSGGGNGTWHASMWDANGLHDLGYLPGYPTTHVCDINSSGMISGWSDSNTGHIRPFTGDVNGIHDIGDPAAGNVWAYGNNDLGQVVGVTSGPIRGCVWDASGFRLLPDVPGRGTGNPTDINNSGLIIGSAGGRACYWDATGGHDLGAMVGPDYSYAYGVNESGWIVGFARDSNGRGQAILWQPVPEPASILALITGLAGIGGVMIRRRK